jgi:Zn-dependent protease
MLRFRLFGFPIYVSPTFLILGVFLLDSPIGAQGILSFVAAAFASVIIHELGHAFAVRQTGGVVQQITLHGLGGATSWVDPHGRINWSRKILIAAAGAGLGFVVAGILYLMVRAGLLGQAASRVIISPFQVALGTAAGEGWWGVFFLGAFIYVTIAWGLINWLPIGGLDGWHILSELLEKWLPNRGRMLAAMIGVLVAAGAGWFLFSRGYRFAPIILMLFALQAFSGGRGVQRQPQPAPPEARGEG